jgi:hypothetical protein
MISTRTVSRTNDANRIRTRRLHPEVLHGVRENEAARSSDTHAHPGHDELCAPVVETGHRGI